MSIGCRRTAAGLGVALTVFLGACVTEPAPTDGVKLAPMKIDTAAPAPPPRAADSHRAFEEPVFPPGLLPPVPSSTTSMQDASLSPYHRFSHRTVRSPDGRLTRLYWVRATQGEMLKNLILRHTLAGDPTIAVVDVVPMVDVDDRTGPIRDTALENAVLGAGPIADLLTVTSTDEVLGQVDAFLTAFLTETPQIEIEAQVFEILYEDGLEIGTNLSIVEGDFRYAKKADGTPDFTKPLGHADDKSSAFQSLKSPFDPDTFLAGGQIGSLALAVVQDELTYKAIIRALQTHQDVRVNSAPRTAVLNGHRAVIDTGERTPVLQPVLGSAGNLTQVQVKYEDTGVRLVVTPFLLMDDMVQIDVTAEVSFVAGFIESGATGILNPIISQRNAATVVNLRDGATLFIGGLVSTQETELVSKIPILGDIPILGYLFKTRSTQETQSQVIFRITPRILRKEQFLFDPGT